MITHLYVSPAVSTLQFELETAGDIALSPAVAAIKDAITNRMGNTLRVVIFRMNTDEFSGLFAIVNAPISKISGVVGAGAAAMDVAAKVTKLSQINNLAMIISN